MHLQLNQIGLCHVATQQALVLVCKSSHQFAQAVQALAKAQPQDLPSPLLLKQV